MAISSDAIVQRILPRVKAAGMEIEVSGRDSHTAELIKIVVEEVVREIILKGEVELLTSQGLGVGNLGAPVTTTLVTGTGKGIIR